MRVPFGIKVVRISPSLVTLDLERTLQRTVPVRPRLIGRLVRIGEDRPRSGLVAPGSDGMGGHAGRWLAA